MTETGDKKPRGIICPHCGGTAFRTLRSARLTNGSLARRRECKTCGGRMTTDERPRRAAT